MSHVTCPRCSSKNHTQGYGHAAGGIGSYTICDDCICIIEWRADPGGYTAAELRADKKAWKEYKAKNHKPRADAAKGGGV